MIGILEFCDVKFKKDFMINTKVKTISNKEELRNYIEEYLKKIIEKRHFQFEWNDELYENYELLAEDISILNLNFSISFFHENENMRGFIKYFSIKDKILDEKIKIKENIYLIDNNTDSEYECLETLLETQYGNDSICDYSDDDFFEEIPKDNIFSIKSIFQKISAYVTEFSQSNFLI